MKNKTLLIAAAALVAGIASAEAQVYSANVVGYVNTVIPGAGSYSLIANPLDDGAGNQLTNLFKTLPNQSSITTWNGTTFNAAIAFTAGNWGGNAQLPPGTGFFVKNGKASPASPAITNTFVGSVVALAGATTTNSLALGYNLVGSQLPYAGDLTTDPSLNLYHSLANQSSITTWNGSGYNAAVSFTAGSWGGTAPVVVGQGFFVKSGKYGTNWVQTLP